MLLLWPFTNGLLLVLVHATTALPCFLCKRMLSSVGPDVQVSRGLGNDTHVLCQSATDLQDLFRDNLEADLKYWRSQNLSMDSLEKLRVFLSQRVQYLDCVRLVLIYQNRIWFPLNKGAVKNKLEDPANGHLLALQHALTSERKLIKSELPNVMFYVNVNDNVHRWCSPVNNCSAPLFSYIKHWGEKEEDRDTDILVPQMLYKAPPFFVYPWELKKDVAFFRGTGYCVAHKFTGCSRTYLAHLTYWHGANHTVDAGLTSGWGARQPAELKGDPLVSQHGVMQPIPSIPIREHAKYRYLMQLDGITASFRLAQLMHCNSIIMKQKSNFIEYFYRSIKEGVHYVSFWEAHSEDVFDVVAKLRSLSKSSPKDIQDMITASMNFAYKYTSEVARMWYWKVALEEYKKLIPDMDEHIDRIVVQMRKEGVQI